jgi:NMD protein affecting ribosome stability and mRNA decay
MHKKFCSWCGKKLDAKEMEKGICDFCFNEIQRKLEAIFNEEQARRRSALKKIVKEVKEK